MKDGEEFQKFLAASKEIGKLEFLVASIFLLSGLRKQEAIALRWESIDFERGILLIKERYEQASGNIIQGTKSGLNITRQVPVPKDLINLLSEHRKTSKFDQGNDFVLSDDKGHHFFGWDVSRLINAVRDRAGFDVSTHSLRHSYGRQFVANGGSVKILQSILGHSSSSVTDLYSDLAGKRIEGAGETVNLLKK